MEMIIGVAVYFLIGVFFSVVYLKTNKQTLVYRKDLAQEDSMLILAFWPAYVTYKMIDLLNRHI